MVPAYGAGDRRTKVVRSSRWSSKRPSQQRPAIDQVDDIFDFQPEGIGLFIFQQAMSDQHIYQVIQELVALMCRPRSLLAFQDMQEIAAALEWWLGGDDLDLVGEEFRLFGGHEVAVFVCGHAQMRLPALLAVDCRATLPILRQQPGVELHLSSERPETSLRVNEICDTPDLSS